jgi:hypothetical protein
METNGVKPPQEPKGAQSMMQEMMDKCSSGELSPADMCRRMMRSMERTSDAEAASAPETGTTSDERGSGSHGEARRGCCGPQSCYAPKRP